VDAGRALGGGHHGVLPAGRRRGHRPAARLGPVARRGRDLRGPHRGSHDVPAPAHGLGHRARDQAGRPGGPSPHAGGRGPGAHRRRGGRGVSTAGLTLRQVSYTNKAFWRNPQAAFFTFAFPLMFLVIFTSLLGGGTVILHGLPFNQSTYYVAGMSAFAIVTACYTNLAISVTFQRDAGILKRTRGTPLPGADYLSARVIHAVLIAVLLVAICASFGAAFYHASVPTGSDLVRTVVVVLVGAASF